VKALLVFLGLMFLFSWPANAQVAQSYASTEEFQSSRPYLGYEILMEGIGCLRGLGLYSGQMPTEEERSQDVELRVRGCLTRLDLIMDRLDELFPKSTANAIQRYYTAGLVAASNRYLACLAGKVRTCEAQEGGITAAIHLMETSTRSIEAKLNDWYLGTFCALSDSNEASVCTDPVTSRSNDAIPSYATEQEFLASQSYLAYQILLHSIDCIRGSGLFEEEFKISDLEFLDKKYLLTRCVGYMGAIRPHLATLFPREMAEYLDSTIHNYSLNLGTYIECWDDGASACENNPLLFDSSRESGEPLPSVFEFPVWAGLTALQMETVLTTWFDETWCSIHNRSQKSSCPG
jgi:hypothetical protein